MWKSLSSVSDFEHTPSWLCVSYFNHQGFYNLKSHSHVFVTSNDSQNRYSIFQVQNIIEPGWKRSIFTRSGRFDSSRN